MTAIVKWAVAVWQFSLPELWQMRHKAAGGVSPQTWLVSCPRLLPTRRSLYGDPTRPADVFTGAEVLFAKEPLFLLKNMCFLHAFLSECR